MKALIFTEKEFDELENGTRLICSIYFPKYSDKKQHELSNKLSKLYHKFLTKKEVEYHRRLFDIACASINLLNLFSYNSYGKHLEVSYISSEFKEIFEKRVFGDEFEDIKLYIECGDGIRFSGDIISTENFTGAVVDYAITKIIDFLKTMNMLSEIEAGIVQEQMKNIYRMVYHDTLPENIKDELFLDKLFRAMYLSYSDFKGIYSYRKMTKQIKNEKVIVLYRDR